MLFKKKFQLIGLDIGSRTIKVAESEEKKSGWSLKKFGMIDIEPGLIEDGAIRNPEAVADAIRQLIKVNKIKESNVVISIAGFSIIVKNITVQTMDENQLQETIKFEAEQYIPFDIQDVNLDFQIMGVNESNQNQMNVLLVAAKKEMVNDYVNLVKMAGLNPCIIDVDAFALQNIYEINYETEGENVALIDIGANKTTLNILKGNMSVFMRDVSLGCQQINQKVIALAGCSLEEAEELYQNEDSEKISAKDMVEIVSSVVTDWCTEIRRALDFFYSTYPDDQIKKIILSGGGANIKKFRQLLAVETASEVEIIKPFGNYAVDGSFDQAYLDKIAPQAAICMGLSIRKVDDK
ncbi:Type IV pilus assembly protein PilM domain-containing protein [Desulfonema limicola]|uniref:Type IV pilus assembly protein PilM domain-containing protein n=1 Tax=Desulfonema limicola TaxID=45656 RepID=A0A975BEI9_9BACT|nr:type IV pilus assembly protein PilM [Desulfonema limicola]QTA83650.1 Type IV pilus assembly protein PilM domain-containing protein [Desulfonema limicola]